MYDILGLDRNASEADIKKAYRKLAMKHHRTRVVTPSSLKRYKLHMTFYPTHRKRKTLTGLGRKHLPVEEVGFPVGSQVISSVRCLGVVALEDQRVPSVVGILIMN